ncbi:MAG: SOS response-associated peptidase [Rhodovibrionaceae bacterium]
MCGRFTQTSTLAELQKLFAFEEQPNLAPRANVAPTQDIGIIRLENDGKTHWRSARWGLIPAWAKDLSIGAKTINARAETLAEKPAFREAFARRRCLIPADGFYEWKSDSGGKQPYRITLSDGRPFAFAGLWEVWRDPAEDRRIESCSIVTTEAAPAIREIHHRMPVILEGAAAAVWLEPEAETAKLQALLAPYAGELRASPVSQAVNRVANDSLDLLKPLPADAPRADGRGQFSLL